MADDIYGDAINAEIATLTEQGDSAQVETPSTPVETPVDGQVSKEVATEAVAPAAAAPATLDDAALSKLADSMLGRMSQAVDRRQPAQAAREPEITPEQIAALKPVTVTREMLTSLGFENASPEQVKGFQLFANAIVEHAAHVSAYVNQQQLMQAEQRYQPVVGYYEQQQQQAARSEFFTEHKDLQKFERFVAFAASKVSPTKVDGSYKSAKDVSKEVADLTRSMLSEAGVNLKDGQNSANQGAAPVNTVVPKMTQLDGAGRSMSGSSNTGKPNNPQSAIYED